MLTKLASGAAVLVAQGAPRQSATNGAMSEVAGALGIWLWTLAFVGGKEACHSEEQARRGICCCFGLQNVAHAMRHAEYTDSRAARFAAAACCLRCSA